MSERPQPPGGGGHGESDGVRRLPRWPGAASLVVRSSAERSVPPPSPSRRMQMLGSQQESVSDELE